MKIVLFGNFGVGNLGNEGSLEAMLAHLRRDLPDADFRCVCPNPAGVLEQFGLPARQIRNIEPDRKPWNDVGWIERIWRLMVRLPREVLVWFSTMNWIRGATLMVIPGTGILDDFSSPPFGFPYDLLRWCVSAKLCGVKVCFASIGAGPINHPVSRWLMKNAARAGHFRSYRDKESKAYVAGLGLDVSNDPVQPDLAFSLARPSPDLRLDVEGNRLQVGVGVMAYYGWGGFSAPDEQVHRRYMDKLAEFVIWLLDQGHSVRLLIGEDSDTSTALDLVSAVAQQRPDASGERLSFRPTSNLHQLMEEIGRTHVVVGTRFHNAICGLMMNRPVVSLGYGGKNDALLRQFGLGEYCQHVDEFEVAVLQQHFQKVLENRHQISCAIAEKNVLFSSQLNHQYKNIVFMARGFTKVSLSENPAEQPRL
jgi:polysaccharide pyruvyl transferase WcaK-like protein